MYFVQREKDPAPGHTRPNLQLSKVEIESQKPNMSQPVGGSLEESSVRKRVGKACDRCRNKKSKVGQLCLMNRLGSSLSIPCLGHLPNVLNDMCYSATAIGLAIAAAKTT